MLLKAKDATEETDWLVLPPITHNNNNASALTAALPDLPLPSS